MSNPRPDYRVYRSGPLSRLRGRGGLERLRRRDQGSRSPREPGRLRRRLGPGPILRLVLGAALVWTLLSTAIFFASAQLNQGVSSNTEAALDGGSSLLTGSNILVLGSDQRPEGSQEPGAGGPARADSILLLRASIGQVRRVSVLRDSYAEIPGHGAQKINAAYALGGPDLMIRTVEQFLGNGLEINHVIQVSFQDFPTFIDSLGGIDVTLRRCVSSAPFGGRRFRLSRGEQHLNGRQALAFARVRKNRCSPNEDDRARARRQQQVLSAIRSRLLSPAAFARLPLVSWQGPMTLDTDMAGPGLLALFADVVTGGSGDTRILRPESDGPGGSLIVSEQEKEAAVAHLRGRDVSAAGAELTGVERGGR